jgi:catechol 2,3-dioxygenase-like lactoylglutathione lyase family enzyme
MNRRTALYVLGGAALWGKVAAAQQPALQFSALDHLEFFVSDIQRSIAFYTRIFGNELWKNKQTARRYLKLGSTYMAIEQGPDLRVDHFCAGIAGFQIANLHSFLEQRGVMYRDYPSGRDLYVADPDSIRLQMGVDNSWTQLTANTAAPDPVASNGAAIFKPVGLDHILLNVTEPEKSAAFYEKVLGPVTQRNNNRIWFQVGKSRIGLLKTPAGQRPGVNHFCVSASAFDYNAATKALEMAGAKMETPDIAGAPQFRDPDGFMVQVSAAP